MGNWRTVNMTGSMSERDAQALREYLGYRSYRFRDREDPALARFGPLSFCRDQPSLYGINDWPAAQVSAIGNLAERDYSPQDVAEHLRELLDVAGSMMMTVHCGGDYESTQCVATIRTGKGLVVISDPEVERVEPVSDWQALANLARALS